MKWPHRNTKDFVKIEGKFFGSDCNRPTGFSVSDIMKSSN